MLKDLIIKARKEQGISQKYLALKIGVRQATMSDFENGKYNLGSNILEKILETLNIDIMKTIEEKKMQIELSSNIAKELISKGIDSSEKLNSLTLETIHMMTREKCGDYILSLKRVSEAEYEKMEKRDEGHKTWNLFLSLLKFDLVYLLKTS